MNIRRAVAAALLGLSGCASPLFKAETAVFQGHPRVAIVAFDSYDWNFGQAIPSDVPVSATLEAAHQVFLTELARAQLDGRDVRVDAECHGDLGDLCKRVSVAALSPVNLSPAVADAVGASMPADLLVEVHLLRDVHSDGFWSAAAGSSSVAQPTLLVRAFSAQGKQVWEDQQILALPWTRSRRTLLQSLDAAVQVAARRVVARLAEQTRPGR